MNGTGDSLEQLRDLHLPEPVSFWPPAMGWWIIALILLVVLALSVWVIKYRKRTAPRRVALAELTGLKAQFDQTQDSVELMKGLSQLLRRYALVCFDRQNVAGLTGMDWLTFLDEQGQTRQFSNEFGRHAFTPVPYGSHEPVNAREMADLVERWIKQIPLPTGRKAA